MMFLKCSGVYCTSEAVSLLKSSNSLGSNGPSGTSHLSHDFSVGRGRSDMSVSSGPDDTRSPRRLVANSARPSKLVPHPQIRITHADDEPIRRRLIQDHQTTGATPVAAPNFQSPPVLMFIELPLAYERLKSACALTAIIPLGIWNVRHLDRAVGCDRNRGPCG